MPKRRRVWYPGARYHIVNRGNYKSKIFYDEDDYQMFLNILKKMKRLYHFELNAYCLMPNHIHLQITTADVSISQIMQHLTLSYSKYHNFKYGLVGHLFQGRYYAELIEDNAYMLQTSRYIHLNPVKAKIVRFPIEYFWSSYSFYMGERESELVSTDTILDMIPDAFSYKEYVEKTTTTNDVSDALIRYESDYTPSKKNLEKKSISQLNTINVRKT